MYKYFDFCCISLYLSHLNFTNFLEFCTCTCLIGMAIVFILYLYLPVFVFVRAHLGHGSQHLLLHLPNPAHKTWSSPCLFINVTFVFGDLNL